MTWTCGEETRSPDFYRDQAAACRRIASLQIHPSHRLTFLRLALYWRSVAHAVGDLVERPKEDDREAA